MLSDRSLLLALLAASCDAPADRGALSIDAGGGMTGLLLAAPFAQEAKATPGLAPAAALGARYALSNRFEVTIAAFYEPPVRYFHNETVTMTESGAFPGTLSHNLSRFGGAVGLRFVRGSEFRLVAALEVGWSRRLYAQFVAVNDADPSRAFDYGLPLPDHALDNLSVSLGAGIEWAAGDHWSVSVVPRAFALIGPDPLVGLVLPLTLSWAFYL